MPPSDMDRRHHFDAGDPFPNNEQAARMKRCGLRDRTPGREPRFAKAHSAHRRFESCPPQCLSEQVHCGRYDFWAGMRRRDFIAALGGPLALPLAVHAQERTKRPRIGFLLHLAPGDPDAMARVSGFLQGLQEQGLSTDRNIQIDYRWAVGQADLYRKYAEELVALAPDVLVTTVTDAVRALQRTTRTIPIVFTSVIDPVGSGLIASLSHPGGNATGFSLFEFGISGKWLELLKQIAPSVNRVAVLRDSVSTRGVGQFAAVQAAASAFGVELIPLDAQEGSEIGRAIGNFAGRAGSGLIVTSSPTVLIHRDVIIKLAAQHRLPAIYPFRTFAVGGGLASYGPDLIDPHRRAAGYVDRILKGEKPADLPVQAPTRFEFVLNLKTAKTFGIEVPPTLLARADEVIE
jgi:ABC-type uncharacterized transport system substrate-binding protein